MGLAGRLGIGVRNCLFRGGCVLGFLSIVLWLLVLRRGLYFLY